MASSIRRAAASIPGIAAALLPNVACPACWPAYAGLLSSLGLGAFLNGPYLMAVLVGCLGLSLGTLAYKARSRRGFGPLTLGVAATGLIIASRVVDAPSVIQWIGAGCLVAASVWNAWHIRTTSNATNCDACGCSDKPSGSE